MSQARPAAAVPRYVPLSDITQSEDLPAMPFRRRLAVAAAPLVRPGRLQEAAFGRAYARVAAGQSQRAVRYEAAERLFGSTLLIGIDPARLEHQLIDTVRAGAEATRLSHWFLDRGDWSGALVRLGDSDVGREIDAVFDHAEQPEEAPAFRALLAHAEAGHAQVRNGLALADAATIRAYFAHNAALRASIERDGLKPRSEVAARTARAFSGSAVRSRKAERLERDIGIAIGAEGEPIRMIGGHHRTAIARRLGLPRIPVQIRLVHAEWLRGWISRTGLGPARALAEGLRGLSAALLAALSGLTPVLERLT
ncbi:hypothetical protein [Methylobacterium segetis]|uniref:hypothetical protein n=1 Tax=Methylobacterium segetis TaxID=2488750 RepID=UPI00104F795A|nr:hypothetical protein [Methylobacterium segetis]